MALTGSGPWVVTVWIKKWPDGKQEKIEFDKIAWHLLNSKLTKAMEKPNKVVVHGKSIPANMVYYRIRSKKK